MGNQKNELLTILDANFNRCREGLRVCEDVCRFVWRSPGLTKDVRSLRDQVKRVISKLSYSKLISSRNIEKDFAKGVQPYENKRDGWNDIFIANIQRVKESSRVLEEVLKLIDGNASKSIKKIRFKVYEFEKRALRKS